MGGPEELKVLASLAELVGKLAYVMEMTLGELKAPKKVIGEITDVRREAYQYYQFCANAAESLGPADQRPAGPS